MSNELGYLTAWAGYQSQRQLNDEALQGIQRRSNRRVLDTLMETQNEHGRLLREHHALKQESERAIALIRTLVDRSEAFRRLAIHLRDAWQPTDPAELPLKASLKPLLDVKKQELANDPKWVEERDADIEKHIRPARNAKSSGQR